MSIKIKEGKFKDRVTDEMKNDFMRKAVSGAQDSLGNRRLTSTDKLGDWESWRTAGSEIRKHTIDNLVHYLSMLSEQISAKGGHVYFAETDEDARNYIKEVVRNKNATKVVKSKSMVTEEIGLNTALEEIGCEVVETDLGEYILQVDDHDPPSHIVAPALHKKKEQIRDLFVEKLGYDKTEDPGELAKHARKMLREKFLGAEIGITGCNFAVAETGTICIVTNEGNARMVTTIPKTQITVMGMERLVPSLEDLDIMVSLLTRAAVGQPISSYVTLLNGPKAEEEVDGPEDLHVVIVDNGRSKILGTEFQDILNCIRCGACLNVCPVYRHIGGHSYGSIYQGPVGAVLTPLLDGYDDHKDLPYASTLCGACTDVCPVKIPLHDLLLKHRQEIVEQGGRAPISEKLLMKAFGFGASSGGLYESGTKIASVSLKMLLRNKETISNGPGMMKEWTNSKEFPTLKTSRFRDWMSKHESEKKHEER
ncbi:LutB/LldF family L-lactate oxidation iron-sulfur protein [Paenisporosarcina indica]|uniref:LutB/LldF family L-lactate oxidation iron-sulfur protein n=1 Tax=Paenisporosarcina indica TaxID=650093 RepID=UPI00094F5308|nr:LutB/LldF family L-lactate oxidation iron-sulfur protein [Paenisporosarcina indica]